MSGVAEASAVIGLISGVIAIVEAIKTVYDAAGDASVLPKAFREVAQRLPLIRDTLRIAEGQLRGPNVDEASSAAIKDAVENCKAKAEKLENIFQECVPPADASTFDRYLAALRSLGKGHKVEVLMKGLLENVQNLANNNAIKAATGEQIAKLAEAIEAVSAMEPSVPDEMIKTPTVTGRNVHTGTGDLYAADGNAKQFNAKGNAKQFHATTMSFGGMV